MGPEFPSGAGTAVNTTLTHQVAGGARTESYGFDSGGNRNTAGYTNTTGNRQTAAPGVTYTYDAEGNVTAQTVTNGAGTGDDVVTTYGYDHRNRLTGVTRRAAGGVGAAVAFQATYAYDALDRRIGAKVDADGAGAGAPVQRWTAYDGADPYADFDGSNALTNRYLHGPAVDFLLSRTNGAGTTAWYLPDRLGSVRNVADAAGSLTYTATYDSFGKVLSESGAGGDRFKYTGREYEAGAAIYDYRARAYDPATGRFLQRDPIGFLGGDANLHRYVANSPTNATDPSGLAGGWGAFWGAARREATAAAQGLVNVAELGLSSQPLYWAWAAYQGDAPARTRRVAQTGAEVLNGFTDIPIDAINTVGMVVDYRERNLPRTTSIAMRTVPEETVRNATTISEPLIDPEPFNWSRGLFEDRPDAESRWTKLIGVEVALLPFVFDDLARARSLARMADEAAGAEASTASRLADDGAEAQRIAESPRNAKVHEEASPAGVRGPESSAERWAWRPSREQPLPPRQGGSAPSGDIGELSAHISTICRQGAGVAEAEQAWNDGMRLINRRAATFPGNSPVENNFYGVVGGEWRVYIGRPPVPGGDTFALAFNSRTGQIMKGLKSGIRPHPAVPGQEALFNYSTGRNPPPAMPHLACIAGLVPAPPGTPGSLPTDH